MSVINKDYNTGSGLPVALQTFELFYNGIGPDRCFVTCLYYNDGVPTFVFIDESDKHQGTSVTNKVEYIAFNACAVMQVNPALCRFVEVYRAGEDFQGDQVEFRMTDGKLDLNLNKNGFVNPKWTHIGNRTALSAFLQNQNALYQFGQKTNDNIQ